MIRSSNSSNCGGWTRGLSLTILLWAFVAVSFAQATDRLDIFGVGTANGGWTLLDPDGYSDAMFDTMAQAGTTSSRIGASWANIEAVRGIYDWSEVDQTVSLCLTHNITPYCLIVNTPAWASPTGEATHAYAPLEEFNPDFQAFCTALASRYAGQIDHWEFWNEQNGYGWNLDNGFNNVDEYVPFLRLAYNALKAGNPDCVVAIGGLDDPDISPGDATSWRGANYMRLFYQEVAERGWENEDLFDAVADHPYHSRESMDDLRHKLRALHDELTLHGDGHKLFWLTEYGWTTKSDDVSQEDQAQLFQEYIGILLEPEFWYVTMASSLAISDMQTGYEGWGLTDQNLRPKPSFYAFQSIARNEAPQISHVEWIPTTNETVQISWKTNTPATSQVEYGPTASYGVLSALDATPVTDHTITLTGLQPGEVCHFRVLSTAATAPDAASADYLLRCPDATVPNGGFEGGIGSGIGQWWHTVGRTICTDGVRLGTQRSGSHSQAVITIGGWGGRYMDDALYTYVALGPGQAYTFSAWTRLDVATETPDTLMCRVGTDSTGGTDPDSPNVAWSAISTTEDSWEQLNVSGVAQTEVVTVFVQARTLIEEDVWLSMFVDDAELTIDPVILPMDFDLDGDVDQTDFGMLQACLSELGDTEVSLGCLPMQLDGNAGIDQNDMAIFRQCLSGANVSPDPDCMAVGSE